MVTVSCGSNAVNFFNIHFRRFSTYSDIQKEFPYSTPTVRTTQAHCPIFLPVIYEMGTYFSLNSNCDPRHAKWRYTQALSILGLQS